LLEPRCDGIIKALHFLDLLPYFSLPLVVLPLIMAELVLGFLLLFFREVKVLLAAQKGRQS
jgi:hypothetical protein